MIDLPRPNPYWIRLGLPIAIAGLYFAASSRSQPAPLRPFSVQMHVHASMSEGGGSWRAANVNAKKIGLDVLWWSDHDWRIAYHTYNREFGFEGEGLKASVPTYYEPGTDRTQVEGETTTVTLSEHASNGEVKDEVARMTAERAAEGKRSLEVAAAAAKPGWQNSLYEIDSTRRTMKRSLASRVTLSFAVFPASGRDAMSAVRVDLSQQPPDMKAGAIYYVLTGAPDSELRALENRNTKYVRIPMKAGQWNRVTVDVTKDAERLDLGGEDNALVAVSFGVITKGPPARAFFDDYRIRHEIQGEALRNEARRMAAAYQKEYGVINYVGQELSFQAHMNPLGEHVPMIDYIRHPLGLPPAETSDFVHRNGGILSLNHIFGTSRPPKGLDPSDPASVRKFEDARIRELIDTRVYGADILEVGYPKRVLPMSSFLRVWDALSAAGVDVVANGVSDTHTSNGGWWNGNNFVSWIWAKSASIPDLVDGFRRGDVYFGDPVQFKGRVTLATTDGHRMGSVVLTRRPSHTVQVRIEGLPAGAKVRTVTGGQAGPLEAASGPVFERKATVDTAKPVFFRVETYTAAGAPLVFSNPIYFRTGDSRAGISQAKLADCR